MHIAVQLFAIVASLFYLLPAASAAVGTSLQHENKDGKVVERTKRSAYEVLKRLNDMDPTFDRYYRYLLSSMEAMKDESVDVGYPSFQEDDTPKNFEKIAPAYKRQSSSGAQICIWKVCPPTPWRRARKSRPT